MVRVKTPSGWKTVRPGTSVGRVGVPSTDRNSSGNSSRSKTVPHDFIGPLQPGVTREPAPGKTSSQKATEAALVEKMRQIGITAQAQQAQLQQEFKAILDARARIIARGGRAKIITSQDFKTKDKLKITSWKVGGQTVRKVENLDKGTVKYTSYAPPRGGGSVRMTGHVVKGAVPTMTAEELKKQTTAKLDYKKFQTQLKKIEKDLPANIVFEKDKWGNIVNINDKKRGINVSLDQLQRYVSQDKLIAAGLMTKVEAPAEVKTSIVKRIASAFSVKKYLAYRETQRQELYDLYGLKGKDRNFYTLANAARNTQVTQQQSNKVINIAINNLQKDLINPDTAIRAEAALIVAAVLGGPLIGAAVGATYKTPIALAKDVGITGLGDMTWKEVAKKSGYEFGKNALEAYFMMKMFGWGVKGISKFPISRISLVPTSMTSARLVQSGVLSQKIFKNALRKGLDVMGAQYLSSVGVDAAKTAKKVKEKKYKAATVGASALLGSLVGFYGEKTVRKILRKVMLAEDPRLILTKSFAKENRQITVARLNAAQKLLKRGEKLKVKFQKASPVREPKTKKIVTPEKRTVKGKKLVVPTKSAYGTVAVGNKIFLVPKIFLGLRGKKSPVTYWKKWVEQAYKNGWIKTFKQIGIPRLYRPTIYKGNGEYLPINKGETLKAYYIRGQRVANKRKQVQVLIAPKTVLKMKQTEMEIKTIYPNPTGVKASVTRVKVGKDQFGNTIIIESIAPKSVLQKLKFKITEKVKFKKEALKYLTYREAKIAKDLTPRILQNWNFIYKSKLKGARDIRKHMLKVEKNFRKILKHYKIKASEAEIKAVSRLHDILKLRGINIKDEPIIRKALLEGYLNKIPLVKKLKPAELKRVANAIGFHQDVNPRTLKALRLDKFTKAFINADRLDITRYGVKVKLEKLFSLKAKKLVPKNIRKEFVRLNKIRIKKKGFTITLRKKYNSLIKKYPQLKNKKIENKLITQNKAKYKKMSVKQKSKIKAQERKYKDYKESLAEYKRSKRGKKVKPISYKYETKKYKTYKSPKLKSAYRSGYKAGEVKGRAAPTNYKTNYGRRQGAYASGYKDSYKGKYKIDYKTGKYKADIYKYKPSKKTKPIIPIKLPKGFKKKTLKKKVQVFYVKEKIRGKIKNLTPRPLQLSAAKDFLAYRLDNRLSRSGFFEPIGTAHKVAGLPKPMIGFFSKNKRKFRPFKIRVGVKKSIRRGYIEKTKYSIDTVGEKRMLKLSKKRLRKKAKRKLTTKTTKRKTIKRKFSIKRKPSTAIQKQRLRNLAKARAKLKRMRKLKR